MKTRFLALGLVALGLGFGGCKPRGETKTLEEVVRGAEDRFHRVYSAEVSEGSKKVEVVASLKSVADTLGDLRTASGTIPDKYALIGRTLSDLAIHAGYTSRPALGELSEQWLGLHAAAEAPNTRLLISRTYGVLASELEAVGFAVP